MNGFNIRFKIFFLFILFIGGWNDRKIPYFSPINPTKQIKMTGPGVNTVLFVNFMIYEEVFLGTDQSVDADSQPSTWRPMIPRLT